MSTKYLQRYTARERLNHWAIALLFLLAAASGLAFFHPSLYFLSALLGGGSWSRILHPFLGLAVCLCFLGLFLRLWRDNLMTEADREWRKHSGDMLRGETSHQGMPPVGRYNAGQKGVFWLMSLCLALLLITGVMFWQPWFANSFPITLRRIAVLLHAAAAVALVLGVVMHVYAAIWVKGTLRAMTRGSVSEAWAKQHHALWHKEISGRQ